MTDDEETIIKVVKALVEDRAIPITYRNMFKSYLKWKEETGE